MNVSYYTAMLYNKLNHILNAKEPKFGITIPKFHVKNY